VVFRHKLLILDAGLGRLILDAGLVRLILDGLGFIRRDSNWAVFFVTVLIFVAIRAPFRLTSYRISPDLTDVCIETAPKSFSSETW
jgi:hypothetical protein